MESMNLSRAPASFVTCKISLLTMLTLGVTFISVPASAQSEQTGSPGIANQAGVAATPQEKKDNSPAPGAQTDNAPKPDAQRPTLTSDANSIPGKPSISLSEPSRLTFGDRVSLYTGSIFTPEILVGPALGAGLGQLRNDPGEWRQGMAGYGRRFGSGLARNVISRTVAFGFAAADGEDPRYIRSEESGIWARTRHAIAWTFITRNQNGTRMPAFSRVAGAYAAAFAANNWYPSSENNTNHALRMGSSALATSVGFHIFSEFWPDIRRALHFKSQ